MTETRDFLLEIGTEEMPSAPLMNAAGQLGGLVSKGLDASGLSHGEVRVISTPRRLAALVSDVAVATEEIHEVKRGPKAAIAFDESGAPTKAAIGFARKCGADASELVRRVDSDGAEYVFAERSVASEPAAPILSKLSAEVIGSLQWPNYRSQRWGSEHATFVRPIRWICALLGTDVVPVSYADVTSGNTTRGHRVLAPGEHVVATPADYEATLEAAHVLSAERRADAIRAGIERIESERGGAHVDTPKRIFDEVVNLCEWPTVLVGTFDESFLEVPHEIICESMLSNQRYFPIYDASGNLTREFVVVSNADPAVSDTVVSGNEKVVRARLDDAKFFYDEDLKRPMEEFVERLGSVTFQERLGTMLQKVERMEGLAAAVATQAGQDEAGVASAAWSSSPTSRASWAATTPRRRGRATRSAQPFASTTAPVSPATSSRRVSVAAASPSPTSSTPSAASSPSTSRRPAPPTRTRSVAPPSASSPCFARFRAATFVSSSASRLAPTWPRASSSTSRRLPPRS